MSEFLMLIAYLTCFKFNLVYY